MIDGGQCLQLHPLDYLAIWYMICDRLKFGLSRRHIFHMQRLPIFVVSVNFQIYITIVSNFQSTNDIRPHEVVLVFLLMLLRFMTEWAGANNFLIMSCLNQIKVQHDISFFFLLSSGPPWHTAWLYLPALQKGNLTKILSYFLDHDVLP